MGGDTALVRVGNNIADLVCEGFGPCAAVACVLEKLGEGDVAKAVQLVLDELHGLGEEWAAGGWRDGGRWAGGRRALSQHRAQFGIAGACLLERDQRID